MSPGVKGQRVQEIIIDEAANFDADTLICPLCSDVVPMEQTVWREHFVRGTRVSFQTCADCAHVSLCPTNMHGVHGEIIEDDADAKEVGLPYGKVIGHCANCRTPMEWRDGRWRDPEPDPVVAAVNALNARLQRGDIDMDEYLRELSPLVGVEGSNPAADTVSERED